MSNADLAALVAKHRDRDSPMLSVDLALQRLLDTSDCRALQDTLTAVGGSWEAHTASERLYENLPSQPGVYMFVWRPPFYFDVDAGRRSFDLTQVLYVGRAGGTSQNTLRERYKDYRKYLRGDPAQLWEDGEPLTRPARLTRYLTLRPLEYWFMVIDQPGEVDSAEERLIRILNPPLNKDRRPKLRPRPAVDAFTRR